MSWLEIQELRAGYGARPVLDGASLTLEKGEIALVVGPNGSGKSSLLRTIFRQCDYYSAKCFQYNGRKIQDLSVSELRSAGMAYTPQYKNVFDRLTVRENLTLATTMRGEKAQIDEVLEIVTDLSQMLGKSAGQLSGGQRQLLALAMGLSTKPDILLLDEPLAGLDERLTGKVGAIVQHYREQHGIAFVIVEHRFTKLTHLADKCYGMRLGKTVVSLDSSQLRDSRKFEEAMQDVFFL